MNIQLSDHFSYKRLIVFSIPSILMMVFTSIYGVVDGFFVSNYVGKDAFAAVNFIIPFLMILGSLGFMVGTGGSALIGKLLGEGKKEKANSVFSFLIYVTLFSGILIALIGIFTVEKVAILLGAGAEMAKQCGIYGKIVLIGLPAIMLQYEFQSLLVTAEKPAIGLYVTIASGVMNMVLDFVLVGLLRWGIPGAAIATVASQFTGGMVPLFYFGRKNSSLLRLGKFVPHFKSFGKVLYNGSSEFVSNISMSVVSMLYNYQLMKYVGEDGVSAYGVLMYVNMIFIAIFIGYSVGTAPIISYHFGAENRAELHSLLKKSLKIIIVCAVLMLIAGITLAKPMCSIFVGYEENLFDLTVNAFYIYSFTFMFASMPIFGSSFFTALNDGFTSAAISFLRTIVFQIAAVLILPLIFGIDGIWWSLVVAEFVATCITVIFLLTKKSKFGY